MNKNFMPPVSIEKFAAYLDGNLSESEMNRIDALVSTNPDMAELSSISDEVDEGIQVYMQDGFAYEADMTALEDSDFDIPNLDVDITPLPENETQYLGNVACSIDVDNEKRVFDEEGPLNDEGKTVGDEYENDEFLTHQDEDTISNISDSNGDKSHDTSDFHSNDDFFNS